MAASAPLRARRVLTRDGVLVDDVWHVAATGDDLPDAGAVLLPLAAYLSGPRSASHGVWLAPDDDPAALAGHLATPPLIAVLFPKAADGRGFSIAHLLRRAGYAGDLRAIGEVAIDQLFMLRRVGFSSFLVRAEHDGADVRAALARYTDAYQGAFDEPLPAFRRGRTAEGGR